MSIVVRSSLAVAFLLLAACANGPAVSTPSISKIQSRALAQDRVAAIVTGQLREVLIGTPSRTPGVAPVNPLDRLWFWTRPRATDAPDVCQSDQVVFEFKATRNGDQDASSPMRVAGLSASPRFFLLEVPPPGLPESLTDAGQTMLEPRCAKLDPENLDMISAPDAQTVREGIRLFVRSIKLIATSMGQLELECPERSSNCGEAIRKATPADVFSIRGCERLPGDRMSSCKEFGISNFDISVFTSWADENGKVVSGDEQRIVKIKVKEFIVLSHALID